LTQTSQEAERQAGNAQPTIGSGNIWYTAGILLPSKTDKPVRVQPLDFTYKTLML
jgi:hypothetical protein